MGKNIIKVDMMAPLTRIEYPNFGTTDVLGPCLGIGFYNPNTNVGYLLHRLPNWDTPRRMIVPQIESHFERERSDYYIFVAGLRYFYSHSSFQDEEFLKNLNDAQAIDEQIDDILDGLGFDLKKMTKRYNEQEGDHERGSVVIDTVNKFMELRTKPYLREIPTPYLVHHRIDGK